MLIPVANLIASVYFERILASFDSSEYLTPAAINIPLMLLETTSTYEIIELRVVKCRSALAALLDR